MPSRIAYVRVQFVEDVPAAGGEVFKTGETLSLPEDMARGLGRSVILLGAGSEADAMAATSRETAAAVSDLLDRTANKGRKIGPVVGALRRTAAEHSIWFPLSSASNRATTPVSDYTGTLRGAVKGGNSGRWTADPGMTFNGSNHRIECNDSDSNAPQFSSFRGPPIEGFTQSVMACADWASLFTRGDMILAWAVITHPAGGLTADGCIASFGMNADPLGKGGWGFGIKSGASAKVRVWHRGVGAAAMDVQDVSMSGVVGNNSTNTRTAIALEIVAGLNGYIEVSGYMLGLGDDGGSSQNNVGIASFNTLANSGTGAVGQAITSPLMIGAMADSVPISRNTPAGTINTGSSGNVTFSADFGAKGKVDAVLAPAGLYAYNTGIWVWFGPQSTTPALTAGYYWVVMNNLRTGTIYSNGPGSAALNITTGGSITVPTPNRVNHFGAVTAGSPACSIAQVGIERRAYNQGIGMQVCRALRGDIHEYPVCLE